MFTVDAGITELKLREKNLIRAFFSMNNHQVATPEMMLEDARSYTLFYRESTGKISAYIGMYLLSTGRKIFYAHDSNPFPEDKMSAVEEEALGFAEGLGAMLDQVGLSNMSDEEKRRWIDSQDIFALKVEEPIAVEVTADPAPQEPEPAVVAPAPPQTPADPVVAATPPPPPPPPSQPIVPIEVIAAPQTQVSAPAPQPPVAPSVAAPEPQAQQPAAVPVEDRIPRADTEVQQVQRVAEVPSLPKKNKAAARPKPDAASLNEQDIMEQAIKAGIVKSSNLLKKDTRSAAGVVGRDKEALARLLTSF